jgi:hypothetical protein
MRHGKTRIATRVNASSSMVATCMLRRDMA